MIGPRPRLSQKPFPLHLLPIFGGVGGSRPVFFPAVFFSLQYDGKESTHPFPSPLFFFTGPLVERPSERRLPPHTAKGLLVRLLPPFFSPIAGADMGEHSPLVNTTLLFLKAFGEKAVETRCSLPPFLPHLGGGWRFARHASSHPPSRNAFPP